MKLGSWIKRDSMSQSPCKQPPPRPPFEIYRYDPETFFTVLAKIAKITPFEVQSKLLASYLSEYLEEVGVKTILVENNYVDRDFLEDFAGYYVRCFREYDRLCYRLHFFRGLFDALEFGKVVSDQGGALNPDILQHSYVGFVVVKPLPRTIIGRTCIITYPSEGRRDYPIVREYEVNLFGIRLKVDSLAFQEQDSVVAACATSALWSVFQKTGKIFNHHIPSPVEITKSATIHSPIETRSLPNKGLSIHQMAQAMQSVYLEPVRISVNPIINKNFEHLVKGNLYAYLRGHVPLILTFALYDPASPQSFANDLHGVAVTGFGIDQAKKLKGLTGCMLRAYKINKLYVHDDQVGPFAKMEFDNEKISVKVDGVQVNVDTLSTSWLSRDKSNKRRAMPDILLVPLYHKIRIPFEIIYEKISIFDNFIKKLLSKLKNPDNEGEIDLIIDSFEWDIYLTTVNETKSELFASKNVHSEAKEGILLRSLPRFLWRATAYSKDSKLLDLVFDATDIEQGSLLMHAIEYDKVLSFILRFGFKIPAFTQQFRYTSGWEIINWFNDEALL